MLTKLLKYEFKATARVMVPLYALAAFLACVAQMTLWEFAVESGNAPHGVSLLFLVAAAAAMGAAIAVTVVLMIQRFRSNLLGNEGHVMLTLPVSVHQHILSKLIVAVLWMMATWFVLFEFFMVLGFRSTIWSAFPQFQEAFDSYLSSAGSTVPPLSWGGSTALAFVALMATAIVLCLEFYVALVLGYSFHKHKGLLSVAFFLIIHLAGNIPLALENIVSSLFSAQTPTGAYLVDAGIAILLCLLWAAVLYAVTCYTLQHRLNLE